MMTTVPHVTSSLGLRKFQADGFLLTRVYNLPVRDGKVLLPNKKGKGTARYRAEGLNKILNTNKDHGLFT